MYVCVCICVFLGDISMCVCLYVCVFVRSLVICMYVYFVCSLVIWPVCATALPASMRVHLSGNLYLCRLCVAIERGESACAVQWVRTAQAAWSRGRLTLRSLGP